MRTVIAVVVLFIAFHLSAVAQAPEWSVQGKAVTADNCLIGCPCIFGEKPSHGRCQYTGIFMIEKGNYGNVKLDNVKFALGGAFGRSAEMAAQEYDFVAYYIDAAAKADQKDALRKIFASPEMAMFGKPAEIKEAPITFTGMEHFGHVGNTYGGTVGDVVKVNVTPVSGAMAGQAMVVENSAEPLFTWTALGKTSESYFKGAKMDWTYNGTSGESHKFLIASAKASSEKKGHH